MSCWLIKGDPDEYGADDLARDGQTVWDGVSNPTALRHLRAMKLGDELLVYHTGDQRAIVACARVSGAPAPDPKNSKLVTVPITFVQWLRKPVSLVDVKADAFFQSFDLVRLSRLSVMPVTPPQWERLLAMAGGLRET